MYQIDMAVKELMDMDPRNLSGLFFQSKDDINLAPKEGFHTSFVLEYRKNLNRRIRFREKTHGFRQEKDSLPNHQTDGNAVLVFGAEVLSLLNGAL